MVLGLNGCNPSLDNPGILNGDIKDYQAPASAGNLWDNISEGFQLNHYSDRPEVQAQIKWFMRHKEYLQRVATRATPYAYYILEQVKIRNMPTEMALLPIVESAYNPFLYSNAGAAGLWQFMPGTASGFKLRQDWWYDGRRDIYASTKAALNYLVYLSNEFQGNWLLALAAYNSGEGTVSKAVKRNLAANLPTDFWDLDLPAQTRAYVPKLLALATILEQPEKYPVDLPPIPDIPYLAVVTVGVQINLNQAAKFAGISVEELYTLNPGYKKWATDPDGPHKLIIPVDKVNQFKLALASKPNTKAVSWKRYMVRQGDSLNLIAKRHGTTSSLIEKLNDINSRALQVGQALLIPIGSRTLPSGMLSYVKHYLGTEEALPGQSRTLYIVRRGDTLERIALRYHVTINQITYWNQLSTKAKISIGDEIIIWSKFRRARGQYYSSQVRPYVVQHTVVTGDKLQDIARKYHLTVKQLREANNLKSNTIRINQVLAVPPVVRRINQESSKKHNTIHYKVKAGDNVSKIADRYNVKTADLRKWNHIGSNNMIRVGETLVLYR